MTESPDLVATLPAPAATATAEIPAPAAPTFADLTALEQRLTSLVAQASGIRADEARQLRDQLGDVKRDIQIIRAHQETQDRRTDALENEVRPAIRNIEANSSRIDTTLNSLFALLDRDRKTVDDHTTSIQQLTQQATASAEKSATIDRDVGDLRTRLADVVNPLAHMVLGDAKTPSMLERLAAIGKQIEDDRLEFHASVARLEKDVQPVIKTFTDWDDRFTRFRAGLKTPRGMAMAFGVAALVIELFSKIDLIGIIRSFGSLFTFTGG